MKPFILPQMTLKAH